MTSVTRFTPLLCGTHRYEKSLSTRGRGAGVMLEAPILAYLIETKNGRILYDVGCDYNKVNDPPLRRQWYENPAFAFGPPQVTAEQRLPSRLSQLGLSVRDIDCVICGHLHFDHAGGLVDIAHADVHVHQRELAAMQEPADDAYFHGDFSHPVKWCVHCGDYALANGVHAIETPGHTAGHMSLLIELPKGKPVLLCGDAADLTENLDEEIAPGLCWQDNAAMAINSIRKLKQIAHDNDALLWPNHDMAFFHAHNTFPTGQE
jgi:N-acyl homoserine lactone hydrolase